MIQEIEILVYETETRKSPFYKWLDKLDFNNIAIIETRLDRISTGNFGNCESLRKELWELKIDHGAGYRVYFGKIGNTVILLLSGGDKSTQSYDIEMARAYWLDYKERKYGKDFKLSRRINKEIKRPRA